MEKAVLFIESDIVNVIMAAGIPANLQGFQFLKEAVFEIVKNPSMLQHLTKELYPKIASAHNVKTPVVERSIRHAIEVAFRSQSLLGINELLSAPVFSPNDKPCNGALIALFAEIVKRNLYKYIATNDDNDKSEKAQTIREVHEFLNKCYDK